MSKRATRKKIRARVAAWGVMGLVLCYLVVSFIQTQVEIASKKQELSAAQTQLTEQLARNTELSRVLESGTEEEIMERIARDRFGYAMPGERVFVDTSGK